MPVNNCSSDGKPGYKWGDAGKCYIYTPGNESSMTNAKKKALAQGIAIGDINVKMLQEELDKLNEVQSSTMGSGIKNPQQGYKPKPRFMTDEELDYVLKNLKEWFRERWVDISRPKPGGGFEECGRSDASQGKYPKCVPASRAARMTPEEIASAVRRKRRAESTQTRDGKKPIYVSTEKAESRNVPTNPALYARVKAEAKRLFDVYPSAYANAWLVREYKKRGGGYRRVNKGAFMEKVAEDLTEDEAALADALLSVAERFGHFDEPNSGIWVGYESAEENDDKDIGVHCGNCVLYEGEGKCSILSMQVEQYGKCRFAIIPDNVVVPEMDDEEEDEQMSEDDMGEEDELISMLRQLLESKGD